MTTSKFYYDTAKKRPHIDSLRDFFYSPLFLMIPAFVASICAALGPEYTMVGILINAEIGALVLFLCDDFAAFMMPLLAVLSSGATLFNDWETILPYIIPWGIPIALGFVFHFAYYRRPARIGILFYGILATAIAVMLGGAAAECVSPFSGASPAFYYFGLSLGMLFFYWIFSSNYKEKKSYDALSYFMMTLLFVGLIGAVIILCRFVTWYTTADGQSITSFRSFFLARNSLSNIMIMTLPAPFYLAKQQTAHPVQSSLAFFVGLLIAGTLVLSTSRSAITSGSILFVLCLVYYMMGKKHLLLRCLHLLIPLVFGLIAILRYRHILLAVFHLDSFADLLPDANKDFMDSDAYSPRLMLFSRSLEDFASYPLFGIGLLSRHNRDIFNAKPECIIWYHSYFPQIWGSLGSFGCVAFSFLLSLRTRLMLCRPNEQTIALSLCAIGSFLFSMTDPGEFMPIPFGMMAVWIFVMLEKYAEESFFASNLEKKTLLGARFW